MPLPETVGPAVPLASLDHCLQLPLEFSLTRILSGWWPGSAAGWIIRPQGGGPSRPLGGDLAVSTLEMPRGRVMNPLRNLFPARVLGQSRLHVRALCSLPDHFPGALPALAEEKLDVGTLAESAEVCGLGDFGLLVLLLHAPRAVPVSCPGSCVF